MEAEEAEKKTTGAEQPTVEVLQDARKSGLECLRVLFSQVRHAVNFAALMTSETLAAYDEDPAAVLMKLAEAQQLRPERFTSEEVFSHYSGPVMVQLKDGAWALLFDSRQLSAEKAAVVAPTIQNRVVQLPPAELKEKLTGVGLVFGNLAQVDAKKQTRLTSFTLVARHHNKPVDIRELMHAYAVGEEEVRENLFRKIVSDRGFGLKRVKLSWKELQKSDTVFPCIAVKADGNYAVLCGFRKRLADAASSPRQEEER